MIQSAPSVSGSAMSTQLKNGRNVVTRRFPLLVNGEGGAGGHSVRLIFATPGAEVNSVRDALMASRGPGSDLLAITNLLNAK